MEITEQTREQIVQFNGQMIEARLSAKAEHWAKRVNAIRDKSKPTKLRLKQLRTLAGSFAAEYKSNVACKRGCSHCCYIAVGIMGLEAEVIGEAIGRKPEPVTEFTTDFSYLPLGYDNPCTFLKNNECSIYEDRPLACRIHSNLEPDNTPCRLDKPRETSEFNLEFLYSLYAEICLEAPRADPDNPALADIRKWFPPEEACKS